MVTICTASLTFSNSTFCPHCVFMCFVWIWEQTAIISPYNINWLVCTTKTECVYCTVQAESSNVIHIILSHCDRNFVIMPPSGGPQSKYSTPFLCFIPPAVHFATLNLVSNLPLPQTRAGTAREPLQQGRSVLFPSSRRNNNNNNVMPLTTSSLFMLSISLSIQRVHIF